MKKILVLAALTMASAPAFASKARMTALSSSAHLVDVQSAFDKPYQFAGLGEFATVEFGPTTAASGVKAEGGFLRQMNDSFMGAYVGRAPTALAAVSGSFATVSTNASTFATAYQPNNPFNVFYASKAGDLTWGANLYYLSSNVKSASGGVNSIKDRKTNAMGVSLGATNGTWDVSLVQGLTGKAEWTAAAGAPTLGGTAVAVNDTAAINMKSTTKVAGGFKSESLYYYGHYSMGGAKVEAGSTEVGDLASTELKVGVVNSHKNDGVDFFYGIAYQMNTDQNKTGNGTKTDSTKLPLIVGVEADANQYVVLRGSLTQNFPLLGSTKTDDGNAATDDETDTLAESTTVNAGLGLKLGKFMVDATLNAATSATGAFGFDANFVANTSLTYNF